MTTNPAVDRDRWLKSANDLLLDCITARGAEFASLLASHERKKKLRFVPMPLRHESLHLGASALAISEKEYDRALEYACSAEVRGDWKGGEDVRSHYHLSLVLWLTPLGNAFTNQAQELRRRVWNVASEMDRPGIGEFREKGWVRIHEIQIELVAALDLDFLRNADALRAHAELALNDFDTWISRYAAALRRHGLLPAERATPALGDGEEDDDDFPEGKVLFRLHRTRERSPALRDAAKRRAQREHGRLFCAACDFDFGAKYGAVGDGYIECHHTTPVSELSPESKSRVEDIALLCANCHRMVHRRRPWLTLANLKDLIPPHE